MSPFKVGVPPTAVRIPSLSRRHTESPRGFAEVDVLSGPGFGRAELAVEPRRVMPPRSGHPIPPPVGRPRALLVCAQLAHMGAPSLGEAFAGVEVPSRPTPPSTHGPRSTAMSPAPRGPLYRLELIRTLQLAQTISAHHAALASR